MKLSWRGALSGSLGAWHYELMMRPIVLGINSNATNLWSVYTVGLDRLQTVVEIGNPTSQEKNSPQCRTC
jgi:hypothetical protein